MLSTQRGADQSLRSTGKINTTITAEGYTAIDFYTSIKQAGGRYV